MAPILTLIFSVIKSIEQLLTDSQCNGGHDNSYTQNFLHTTSRTTTKTRHFVQKRNQTIRTKMKTDVSCNLYNTTYYYNVVSYVHIPLNAGAKRSGWTCHLAMPQCCYLAKGAKRPSHTTYMLTSLIESSSIHIGCNSTES